MTDEGWVEAGNLDSGDTVHIQNRKGEFGDHGSIEEGRVFGWLVGDGQMKTSEERAVLHFYDEDTELSDEFAGYVNEMVRNPVGNADYEVGVNQIQRAEAHREHAEAREERVRSRRLYEQAAEFGLEEEKLQVPDPLFQSSEEMARGFLQALFTADGSVQGSKENGRSVRLASSNLGLLKETQQLLLQFGVASRIYEKRRPAHTKEMPDGKGGTKEYEIQAQHELAITKDNLVRFADEIGFLLDEKENQLQERLDSYVYGPQEESFEATVADVERDGIEDVYDLTETDTHSFIANGITVHNCGEQPLEEYEACNLGHINLSTLAAMDAPDWRVWSDRHAAEYDSQEAAIAAFLEESIDWEAFDQRIGLGTRFLENVVTMSDFPVDEIEETVRQMRKIGLGIMGLAQLYIQLGIEYGSDTANEVARQLMTHINHESKWTSHQLAEERGTFGEWDRSKFADPTEYREWFEKQTGLDADEWAEGFPIRNHNVTTIAPTGCVEENSLVSTDEGLRPIKNLDGTTAAFEQWDEIEVGVSTDGGTKAATAVYDNGFDAVKTITTDTGFSIAATPDHKFRVLTEENEYCWRKARDIDSSDSIVLKRGSYIDRGEPCNLDVSERENIHFRSDQNLRLPERMSPELAVLLGFYVGDGHLNTTNGVELAVDAEYPETAKRLIELGEHVFGVTATTEEKANCVLVSIGGQHVTRFFEDNGWEKSSRTAFIPDEVLDSSEAITRAFLRGLFEADGTASRKVELATTSETLAKQVQTVLLSLNIVFKRDEKPLPSYHDRNSSPEEESPIFNLRGLNKAQDKKFLDEIGFINKSTDIELKESSYRKDKYPPSVVDAVRETEGYYENCDRSIKNKVNDAKRRSGLTYNLLQTVEEHTEEPVTVGGRELSALFVDTVESVDGGVAYTKDISVPSNNTYVANGFVTHNTTSMVGNTTGGCEPIYNVAYYKNVSDDVQGDEMLVEFDDYFLRVLEENDIDVGAVKQEAQEQMAENEFDGVDGLTTVPDAVGELFVTTGDLSAKEHAGVQTSCQEGVDSAISKTVNAPNSSTLEDAKEVFEYIYDHGGKGVTYYRDGTRSKQVLTTRAQNTEFAEMGEAEVVEQIEELFGSLEAFVESDAVQAALDRQVEELLGAVDNEREEFTQKRPRPDVLHGVTQRIDTGYGKLYVNINEDPEADRPFELFANIGNSGGFTASFTEALAKTISTALRAGVDPEEIAEELQGIRSPKVAWDKGEQIQSIPDAIGTAMQRYLDGEVERAYPQQQTLEETAEEADEGEEHARTEVDHETDGGAVTNGASESSGDQQTIIEAGENPECPECSSLSLYYSEGCKTCESCGWSEC
jgi:ribonucleoside-diphosphate reductase alpha chain